MAARGYGTHLGSMSIAAIMKTIPTLRDVNTRYTPVPWWSWSSGQGLRHATDYF